MAFQEVPRIDPYKIPKPEENRFHLPGHGLPLDYSPKAKNLYGVEARALFPSALDERDIGRGYVNQPLLTLKEIEMMRAMEAITDTPQWHDKVGDFTIAERWKKDMLDRSPDITPSMADWIIEELRFKARIHAETGVVGLYNGDVVKSDCAVTLDLKDKLRQLVKPLEDAPEYMKEYNLDSGCRELDIIHPTMFPLVFGRSRILKDRLIGLDDAVESIGQGGIIAIPEDLEVTREDMPWRIYSRADINVKPFSTDFQMLPCEVQLGSDDKWHIVSYINNLHPDRHRDLYGVIEEILNKIIPIWNITLTPVKDMLHSRARIEYHDARYHPLSNDAAKERPEKRNGETDNEYQSRLDEWKLKHYIAVQPDAGKFRPWAVPKYMIEHLSEDQPDPLRIEEQVNLKEEYGKRGLQVIVRIMKVELDPENPVYETDWHVEGQMNEHICASALYYFDSDNVEGGRMEIRNAADPESIAAVDHEQGDWTWLKQVFGIENGGPAVQVVGDLACKEGRVISYPNTLQHRIKPLRLADPSRPGHRTVLGLFLVDPNIRIISTANVPPQRLDWTDGSENLQQTLRCMSLKEQDEALNRTGSFPFTMEEARYFRKKQREERIQFLKYQDVAFTANRIFV